MTLLTLLPVRLDDLIHARTVESVRIELKATWNDVIAAATIRTIAAFANDLQGLNGGYVVLGIEEQGGRPRLPPQGLDDLDLDLVQKKIRGACARIRPSYQPLIAPEEFQGKSIIVLYAPRGDARPYQAPDDVAKEARYSYYVRQGPETHVAREGVLAQLHQLTARIPFDSRRRPDVSLSTVSPRLLSGYLQQVGTALAVDADSMDVADVLRRLRLTEGINGTEGPRNAALLFFTEDPEALFPGCRIELGQFRDDAGGDLVETRAFRGPIDQQVTQALDFLASLFGEVVRKAADNIQAERFVAYPTKALREAIVNAVYHRSYEGAGYATRIGLYPDRVEVTSYPGPMPGIEASHLLPGGHLPQVPARNPLVGEMLKALRLAETWHTGIPKIRRAMADNGSPAPAFYFDESRSYFRVTLPAHPGYVVLHASREAAALWHLGEHERAIGHLRDALGRVPESGALTAQAIAYLSQSDDLGGAQQIFASFDQTADARERHLAFMALARAYLDADRKDDAATLLERAPAPPSIRQLVDLAILHRKSRRMKRAHRQFTAIEADIRNDPRALYEWASVKRALAKRMPDEQTPTARQLMLREAQELLVRLTELTHDQPVRAASAWFEIAKVRRDLGENESAILDALRRARELNPDEARFREWPPARRR